MAREGEVQNAIPGELVSSPGLLLPPDFRFEGEHLGVTKLRYQYAATTGAAAP